jgi:hypothetical protein
MVDVLDSCLVQWNLWWNEEKKLIVRINKILIKSWLVGSFFTVKIQDVNMIHVLIMKHKGTRRV